MNGFFRNCVKTFAFQADDNMLCRIINPYITHNTIFIFSIIYITIYYTYGK